MAIFRHLVGRVVRHVASDPRTREKAKAFVQQEVAPRARDAARQGRDAFELARDDWRDTGQGEHRDESSARRAGRFLGKLHNRLNQEPK